jgi:hypothetical protein
LKLIIGKYEGTIYPEDNGYTGAIDLGTNGKGDRNRLKRKGRTKEIVKDKLRKAVAELEAGIETSDSTTVENTVHGAPSPKPASAATSTPSTSGARSARTATQRRRSPAVP